MDHFVERGFGLVTVETWMVSGIVGSESARPQGVSPSVVGTIRTADYATNRTYKLISRTCGKRSFPEELRRLPAELARIDVLLDDPVFFAPFVPFFDPRIGRPSTPMTPTYGW